MLNCLLSFNDEPSSNESDFQDNEILSEQVKSSYAVAHIGLIATFINSFIIFAVLRGILPQLALTSWFGATLIFALTRTIQLIRFRAAEIQPASARMQGRYFTRALIITGTLWGSLGLFPISFVGLVYQLLIAFVLGGMSAGAAATFYPLKGGYSAFSVPALAPLIIHFFVMGDAVHYAMGAMLALFGILLWRVSLRAYRVNRASLVLGFENRGMIARLMKAKENADELNTELRAEVDARLRAEAELRAYQNELEKTVQARTSDLVFANEQLKAEINERKQTERALRESEARLALAEKAGRVGVFDIDLVEQKVVWTEQMEELFGLPPGGFNGTYETWAGLVHPEDLAELSSRFSICLRDKCEQLSLQYRCIRADGQARVLAATAMFSYLDDGTPARLIGTNVDITDQKRLEENLEKSNAELRDLNKELEAFSYSVAHDLRVPLMRMEGFSDILITEYRERLSEEAKELLDRIKKSARKMEGIINDLLRLSKIVRQELSITKVDISRMVSDIARELNAKEPERKVEFIIEPGVQALTDYELLKIAMENLIGNAWKFTSHFTAARIEFGRTEIKRTITCYLRDNGIGFDPEQSVVIFTPFHRLHSDREFPGTGIGLATVSRIIKKLGGEIWAEGEQGKGATFYFTLPANSSSR